MFHYQYSKTQLEEKADELIKIHDPDRMYRAKSFDVNDVVNCCSGATLVYKYLSPNQSILGMTAFDDIHYYCWPYPFCPPDLYEHMKTGNLTEEEQLCLPYTMNFPKGTILIEKTLIEDGANVGQYLFTVLHEIFHWRLHQKCFLHVAPKSEHYSTNETFEGAHKKLVTDIDFIEWQANYCASAFLMPKLALGFEYSQLVPDMQPLSEDSLDAIWKIMLLADKFNVSQQAMKYRLMELGLINTKPTLPF